MPSEAEIGFAARQDHRHDQVFLVGEVPVEQAEQALAGADIGIAGKAQPVAVLRCDPEEALRRLGQPVHLSVDHRVVALEDLETALSVWPSPDNLAVRSLEELYQDAGDEQALSALRERFNRLKHKR